MFNKLLHLINPNLNLLNRGGGGGVGLCGPRRILFKKNKGKQTKLIQQLVAYAINLPGELPFAESDSAAQLRYRRL